MESWRRDWQKISSEELYDGNQQRTFGYIGLSEVQRRYPSQPKQ
jgi:hypothetical protein